MEPNEAMLGGHSMKPDRRKARQTKTFRLALGASLAALGAALLGEMSPITAGLTILGSWMAFFHADRLSRISGGH